MNKLHKKRALVTAGAQGIGLAISQHLARAGCDVFVHYHRSASDADRLVAEARGIGVRAGAAAAD
ncbi:MAG TPA: SDR family NAD(P)-dependent oxidoreductase, partial [Opitutaceae bacterium]|nr:SDR family NAD(P)-dependent oxidoreductase [Opitutaceae bacterium]